VLQTINTNQKTSNKKNTQDILASNRNKAIQPKTQFQIDRENGITVEQLKENLLKRVRQLWEK
jgi:hypothetical protein